MDSKMEEERAVAVLKQFYSKVHQSGLSIDAMTQQLRSYHFLTPVHEGELEACDTQVKKTSYIIDHVVKYYLEEGEEKPLDILLKLIGGDDNELTLLVKELKSLSSEKSVLVEKLTANGDETDGGDDEIDGAVKKMVGSLFKKKKDKDTVPNKRISDSLFRPDAKRDYTNITGAVNIVDGYKPGMRRSLGLGSPWLLAKGAGDELFVRDHHTSQVIVFTHQLKYSHAIGTEGELKSIGGIAVNDETKEVYVADQILHCVRKFTLGGKFIYQIGYKGTAEGEFRSPCGILLSAIESLFVCDSNNHRIQVFHNDVFTYTFGQHGTEPGKFDKPEDLAMNYHQDKLFVTSDNRVQVFTLSGQFLEVFGNFSGIPYKLQSPTGIYCTTDGHVLISSYGTHCVLVFREDGTFVSIIKGTHQGKEQFVFPAGVLVMSNGNVVVAGSGNHQLAVF
ncbi:uncharacterized protein [Dysidea avara]|uniref:uncharacterized protein isoform X2 n=1 Tax=Dysidea avara TaxID=196820 RepID=UPI0033183515